MQVLKPLLFCVSILLAASTLCLGQDKQQPPLALILMEMAAHDRYEFGSIGFAAQKSKQYERFEQLTAIATPEQLLDLAANHKSGVVRLYAYQALHRRKVKIPEPLTIQFKNDTTAIRIFMGCIMDTKPINTLVQGSIIRNNLATSKPTFLKPLH